MKECLNCRIKIGGEGELCPICQNALIGDGTPNNWPKENKLRQQAFWYKLQMFVLLAIAAVAVILDFVLDIHGAKHWSLVAAVWIVVGEIVFDHYIHRSIVLANVLTLVTFYTALLLYATGWYLGFSTLVVYTIIPIMVSALMVLNLTLALLDKKGNALVYLLINILVGLVASIVLLLLEKTAIVWTICLMISVVTFIGVAVFFGRKMLLEIQKRMNI